MNMTKNWYLVYSKARQESVAKTNLERQGYQTYMPLIRTPRLRMGRRVLRIEPMFPRYLFIRLDKERDNWAPIRSTLGVSSIVRLGQEPSRVPDDLVDMLRAREDVDGIQDLPPAEFQRGERVRIEQGPLMGYEAIFLAKSGAERVVILLQIVGKRARVRVDPQHLGHVKD